MFFDNGKGGISGGKSQDQDTHGAGGADHVSYLETSIHVEVSQPNIESASNQEGNGGSPEGFGETEGSHVVSDVEIIGDQLGNKIRENTAQKTKRSPNIPDDRPIGGIHDFGNG